MDIEIKISIDGFQVKQRLTDILCDGAELYFSSNDFLAVDSHLFTCLLTIFSTVDLLRGAEVELSISLVSWPV